MTLWTCQRLLLQWKGLWFGLDSAGYWDLVFLHDRPPCGYSIDLSAVICIYTLDIEEILSHVFWKYVPAGFVSISVWCHNSHI